MDSSAWNVVKTQFDKGDSVTVRVVHQKPFGLLVMIDEGIAGVIERIGLFNNGYETLDEFPVGCWSKASVIGFRDWSKQVELQVPARNSK